MEGHFVARRLSSTVLGMDLLLLQLIPSTYLVHYAAEGKQSAGKAHLFRLIILGARRMLNFRLLLPADCI
jgi:hypothetical protein